MHIHECCRFVMYKFCACLWPGTMSSVQLCCCGLQWLLVVHAAALLPCRNGSRAREGDLLRGMQVPQWGPRTEPLCGIQWTKLVVVCRLHYSDELKQSWSVLSTLHYRRRLCTAMRSVHWNPAKHVIAMITVVGAAAESYLLTLICFLWHLHCLLLVGLCSVLCSVQ